MKKTVSMLLAVAMCLSLCVSAFATSNSEDVRKIDSEDIIDYNDIILDEEVIGTSAEALYDNTPNSTSAGDSNIRGSLLFSMTAAGVTGLLVTNSPKSFYKSSLSNGYLKIAGTLNNAGHNGASIKVGACYYDSASSLFIASAYYYFSAGTYEQIVFAQSSFAASTEYRGFIKNTANAGSVTGTLRFYNSDGN